jgi:hypothetical protein
MRAGFLEEHLRKAKPEGRSSAPKPRSPAGVDGKGDSRREESMFPADFVEVEVSILSTRGGVARQKVRVG